LLLGVAQIEMFHLIVRYDEKYIETWNKTMKLLGIKMPLKDLEKIHNEFAKKWRKW